MKICFPRQSWTKGWRKIQEIKQNSSMECFTIDFLRFFTEKRQNLAFKWTADTCHQIQAFTVHTVYTVLRWGDKLDSLFGFSFCKNTGAATWFFSVRDFTISVLIIFSFLYKSLFFQRVYIWHIFSNEFFFKKSSSYRGELVISETFQVFYFAIYASLMSLIFLNII